MKKEDKYKNNNNIQKENSIGNLKYLKYEKEFQSKLEKALASYNI